MATLDASGWLPLFLTGVSTPLGALGVMAFRRPSSFYLGAVLGLAAGVMVMVSLQELLPESVQHGGIFVTAMGLGAGLLAMGAIHALRAPRIGRARSPTEELRATGWSVAVALAIHDVPEGMALVASNAASRPLGLLLAVAVALHNLPEGMSIAAPLQAAGVPRSRIGLVSLAVGAVTPVTALLLGTVPRVAPASVPVTLAFAAGIMLSVAGGDALPTGWRRHPAGAAFGTATGLALMALLHAALMG